MDNAAARPGQLRLPLLPSRWNSDTSKNRTRVERAACRPPYDADDLTGVGWCHVSVIELTRLAISQGRTIDCQRRREPFGIL